MVEDTKLKDKNDEIINVNINIQTARRSGVSFKVLDLGLSRRTIA